VEVTHVQVHRLDRQVRDSLAQRPERLDGLQKGHEPAPTTSEPAVVVSWTPPDRRTHPRSAVGSLILPAVLLSRFLGDIRLDTVRTPSPEPDRFT
jgi:hypothetical protein